MTYATSVYLSELGIDYWQLHKSELFDNYQAPIHSLPESCQMLLVCAQKPTPEQTLWLERVLATLSLGLDQVCHIYPEEALNYCSVSLEWMWFVDMNAYPHQAKKTLTSVSLSELMTNNQHKRALWQRIRQYELSADNTDHNGGNA